MYNYDEFGNPTPNGGYDEFGNKQPETKEDFSIGEPSAEGAAIFKAMLPRTEENIYRKEPTGLARTLGGMGLDIASMPFRVGTGLVGEAAEQFGRHVLGNETYDVPLLERIAQTEGSNVPADYTTAPEWLQKVEEFSESGLRSPANIIPAGAGGRLIGKGLGKIGAEAAGKFISGTGTGSKLAGKWLGEGTTQAGAEATRQAIEEGGVDPASVIASGVFGGGAYAIPSYLAGQRLEDIARKLRIPTEDAATVERMVNMGVFENKSTADIVEVLQGMTDRQVEALIKILPEDNIIGPIASKYLELITPQQLERMRTPREQITTSQQANALAELERIRSEMPANVQEMIPYIMSKQIETLPSDWAVSFGTKAGQRGEDIARELSQESLTEFMIPAIIKAQRAAGMDISDDVFKDIAKYMNLRRQITRRTELEPTFRDREIEGTLIGTRRALAHAAEEPIGGTQTEAMLGRAGEAIGGEQGKVAGEVIGSMVSPSKVTRRAVVGTPSRVISEQREEKKEPVKRKTISEQKRIEEENRRKEIEKEKERDAYLRSIGWTPSNRLFSIE